MKLNNRGIAIALFAALGSLAFSVKAGPLTVNHIDRISWTPVQTDVGARGQMPLALPNPSYKGVIEAALADFETRLQKKFNNATLTVTTATKTQILSLVPSSDTFIYVLDEKQAAEAGFLGFGGSGSNSHSVIIQEYSIYRPFYYSVAGDTYAYRYGVGLRLIVEVNDKKGNISALSIPGVTAKVEAGKLRASIRMQVFGVSGKNITTAFPMPVELNFTTLRQMYEGIDKIKSSIYNDADADLAVEPQLLSGPVINPTGPTVKEGKTAKPDKQ